MTEDTNKFERDSRRAFMKKGALASLGVGLSVGGIGTAAAQAEDGDGLFNEEEVLDAVMYREAFVPGGLFIMVSPNIDAQTEALPEEVSGFLTDFNMRIIRYVRPNTQNIPIFLKDDIIDATEQGEKDAIPPYVPRAGFVVDDNLVQDQGILFDGTPIGELGVEQLVQVRPSIFVLGQEFNPIQETERIVRVNLSPIREQEEDRIFNEFQEEIFGGPNPFAGGGATPTGG